MILSKSFVWTTILAASVALVQGASSWSFDDATVSVQAKGAGIGAGQKDKLSDKAPLSQPVTLGHSDTLKVALTTVEDRKPKRPHQAFLLVKDTDSELETSYPFNVKENGKAKFELTQKELPLQFLRSSKPLEATLILASFGSSQGFYHHAFYLDVKTDPNTPIAAPERPLRYGKLEEIHHTFRADPTSPPKVITLVFTAAVIGALPILLGTWLSLGANLDHLSNALGSSAVAHTLFFGSVVALEGIFFLYYTSWNLFQTLPATAAVGSVAFLSGSRALSEVLNRHGLVLYMSSETHEKERASQHVRDGTCSADYQMRTTEILLRLGKLGGTMPQSVHPSATPPAPPTSKQAVLSRILVTNSYDNLRWIFQERLRAATFLAFGALV
ncbi:MAG: hypothetical protein M1837_002454 [Sclerophora amabilis]|nr:MAG: hypothetical protein M1837_002454 [Sclerophora amabilis]